MGGHRGEEQPFYDELGVKRTLWFEAIEESAVWMKDHFKNRDDVLVVNECLSDGPGLTNFNITNNLASSSLLDLDLHYKYHPKVEVTEVRQVFTLPLDEVFFDDLNEDISDYDMMNLDVQGAELDVLTGSMKVLEHMKYIYTEVNTGELYVGCSKMTEISYFLERFGFEMRMVKMTPYEWGDALYIKK